MLTRANIHMKRNHWEDQEVKVCQNVSYPSANQADEKNLQTECSVVWMMAGEAI
jgi:hypothetical protein